MLRSFWYRCREKKEENKEDAHKYSSDPILNISLRKKLTNEFPGLDYYKWNYKLSTQRLARGFSQYDAWNMYSYLQHLIPNMLQYLKDHGVGSPSRLVDASYGDDENKCKEEWHKILDRMIYLWRESAEDTCSEENKYEDEFDKKLAEFEQKYGAYGKKLMTEDDRQCAKQGKGIRVYTLNAVPEYRDFCKKYADESKRIDAYRERCKDEAFDMLKEYFFCLWD